jgi:hypothetical protein
MTAAPSERLAGMPAPPEIVAGRLKRPARLFRAAYLIACGLAGDPHPPGRFSGGAQKKNS